MRRRSREINIFNMSLLDILCGALGAFCFMMLVLMPYYKPPKEQMDIQKKQREVEEELKKLAEMKDKISDAEMARDLEDLVKKLQDQIKELQGRLNQALAENQQLKEDMERLKREHDQAVADAQQLRQQMQQLQQERNQAVAESEQLRKDKEDLLAQNQQYLKEKQNFLNQIERLRKENDRLEKESRLGKQRQPYIVKAISADASQDVGLYVWDPAVYKLADGTDRPVQSPFNPRLPRQVSNYPGDITAWVSNRGVAFWVLRDIPPNLHLKVYVNLANLSEKAASTVVQVSTQQFGMGTRDFPELMLTPEHPWVYVGEIFGNPDQPLVLKAASQQDREKEWEKVGSAGYDGNPMAPPSNGMRWGSGGPSGDQNRRRAYAQVEMESVKARLTYLKTHAPTERKAAEENQIEIAKLEERLKVLQAAASSAPSPAPSPAPPANNK